MEVERVHGDGIHGLRGGAHLVELGEVGVELAREEVLHPVEVLDGLEEFVEAVGGRTGDVVVGDLAFEFLPGAVGADPLAVGLDRGLGRDRRVPPRRRAVPAGPDPLGVQLVAREHLLERFALVSPGLLRYSNAVGAAGEFDELVGRARFLPRGVFHAELRGPRAGVGLAEVEAGRERALVPVHDGDEIAVASPVNEQRSDPSDLL